MKKLSTTIYKPLLIQFRNKYSAAVKERFINPKYTGSFDKSNPQVGTSMVGAPACGDMLKMQIKLEKDKIIDVRYKVFGCGSAIASSELAAETIIGKTLAQADKVTNAEIANALSLPPVKIHCSLLAEQAIKGAIKHYKSKIINSP